jgi:hypothetical protein
MFGSRDLLSRRQLKTSPAQYFYWAAKLTWGIYWQMNLRYNAYCRSIETTPLSNSPLCWVPGQEPNPGSSLPCANSAGILKQSRNRVRIGLSYRPARLHSLSELIPWNRFLGFWKVKKISGSGKQFSCGTQSLYTPKRVIRQFTAHAQEKRLQLQPTRSACDQQSIQKRFWDSKQTTL